MMTPDDINMGDTLWAWVTETPDGSISLVGAELPGMSHMPLIGRSEKAVRMWEPFARAHGEASGQLVWLRRYTLAEEIGR